MEKAKGFHFENYTGNNNYHFVSIYEVLLLWNSFLLTYL